MSERAATASTAAVAAPMSAKAAAQADRLAARSLDAAGHAAMRGDWRGCADSYLGAYRKASPSWERRYITWSGFTSVLREGNLEILADDIAVVEGVADDEMAPSLHRVQVLQYIHTCAHTRTPTYTKVLRMPPG